MAEAERPTQPRVVVRRSGEIKTGTHIGDRRVRIQRRPPEPREILVPTRAPRKRTWHPAVVFVYGFAGMIVVGSLILTLPFASVAGHWTPYLVALFTATSAVCVTGLVVVDTGTYWSPFGQAVILLLIQTGGFGFMTSSTLLLLLLLRRQVTLRERILLKEALGYGTLGSVYFLMRKIIIFTLVAEGIGAVILTGSFLREVELPLAAWWGVFHAVSAFNNAGFDLTGGFRSLVPFNHDPVLLLTIAGLLILGGISYTVVEDVVRWRRWTRLTLDSKLVLSTTAVLVVLGTLGVLFTERSNLQTLGSMEWAPRLLNAFFQAVSPRTAGFNSVDLSQMTENGLFVIIALMFVGGASGSTAGGIKIQTFSLLFFAIASAVRGKPEVVAYERRVPLPFVLRAIAVALLSLALVFTVAFLLEAAEGFAFLRILFESFSAFATVGLSTGITPELSTVGRILIILTMFAGRLGPLTLVLALAAREHRPTYRWPEEVVKIG